MKENTNSCNDTQPAVDKNKASIEENADSPPSHDSSIRHRTLSSRRIRRWSRLFRVELQALRKSVEQLGEKVQMPGRDYLRCVNIVKNCQEETAKALNRELERHALNPAVLTVVTLADELLRLNDRAQAFEQHAGCCAKLETLKDELQISASMASDRLAYLDIVRIAPCKGDGLETEKHTACGSVHTNNRELHGAICKLLTAGVMYRGKVLQPARVSLFCYREPLKPEHDKVTGEES